MTTLLKASQSFHTKFGVMHLPRLWFMAEAQLQPQPLPAANSPLHADSSANDGRQLHQKREHISSRPACS